MPVLDRTIARQGADIVDGFIERLFAGPANRSHGHLIVGLRTDDGRSSILLTRSYGDPALWEWSYKKIALSKFEISVRTGLNSREVQTMHPELVEPDDTIYWGSVVVGNIVVAFSGIQAYFDEAICYALAYLLRALVQHHLEQLKTASSETNANTYSGKALPA